MVYEGVLLFGVVMLTALPFALVTQQRHALQGQTGLRILMVLVLALYFTGFWIRSGQTLPMKTWHIRVCTVQGGPLGWGRALLRFALAWLWFLPALGIAHASGIKGGWGLAGCVLAGVLAYAALAMLHPSRQFWHDIVSGTRLVDTRPDRR